MLIVTSTVYGKREPMNTNNVENYNERYSPERETYVIKKDGSLEAFHVQKVIDAIGKVLIAHLRSSLRKKRNRSVNASFLI